ncbi:hypothetical protein J1G42_07810 [Cellulomonas sp. zg-ZUI222]|uniref:PH domain-containing protein n=1 Tax=Cellulomonas wangleii TaxID=2816956 RepID=A0ABX8D973_9CELL|nr:MULTISPECIES: hypothetical protein [Cellulomonas]MBO0900356.1 hypothetical protein [Cellulomonas sp. zg-ZUI22]MBO0920730.1 hypothetical protein [Cellulomonas wangleii]MBO0926675.1 hypothetical protein [Cellulomonas wangleii]QVI63994.1 hypothetical protein KG103_09370 [Cellulomonas wangleii]
MPVWASVAILAALAVLGLWGMWRGWQARGRRTAALVPSVPTVPASPGAPVGAPVEAVYVSSTRAGDWLDRVVAHDLGVRSPALVQVHADGVLLTRTGAADVWVPAGALRAVGTSSGQAGKFVGRDELVVLTWVPDATTGTAIDTALQVRHDDARPALLAAARTLAAPTDTETAPPTAQEEQA